MNRGFFGNEAIDAPGFEINELRGFSRSIAEIEWLLVILVLLYQVVQGRNDENSAAIFAGLVLYSGLVNLYMLTVITSALTLGKLTTLLEVGLIAVCYVFLGYWPALDASLTLWNVGGFAAQIAPMVLVAYVTTMLSADIHSALKHIKLISETDELTGIYNVRAFTALADRNHKQTVRHGLHYSIVMFDSDDLKGVNDTYGHQAGDLLLKRTVTCAQQALRQTDVLARYGGDEFIVLLPHTESPGALEVAERIRRAIEATPLEISGNKVPITVSVGVARKKGVTACPFARRRPNCVPFFRNRCQTADRPARAFREESSLSIHA